MHQRAQVEQRDAGQVRKKDGINLSVCESLLSAGH